jgi:selenoprotein W-related protein
MAQEFLTTFEDDIKGVLLEQADTQGQFTISVDGQVLFDRKTEGGFRDIKELKQIIRDKIAPSKNLGHSERS